jgi:hypothetical protein
VNSVSAILLLMTQNNAKQQPNNKASELEKLSLEDRGRLVGTFLWLLEQDRKQNPCNYNLKHKTND